MNGKCIWLWFFAFKFVFCLILLMADGEELELIHNYWSTVLAMTLKIISFGALWMMERETARFLVGYFNTCGDGNWTTMISNYIWIKWKSKKNILQLHTYIFVCELWNHHLKIKSYLCFTGIITIYDPSWVSDYFNK